MPPGLPGRAEYNVLADHEPFETDPAKAKALLEQAGDDRLRDQVPVPHRRPVVGQGQGRHRQGAHRGRLQGHPGRHHDRELSTVRDDPDADINVRCAGWCSDWPSGGSWFPPVLQSTNLDEEGLGTNYAAFSEPEVDQKIDEILTMPIEDQPAAWNELDKKIQEKYFPLFVTDYTGVAQAHGSKINGHNIDATFGMPTWKNIWVS